MGTSVTEKNASTDRLWRALEQVYDPEFPMSIVDLGLVYSVSQEFDRVRVELTFTAMGCPAMDMILADTRTRLLHEPGVREVEIEIVWDPPWNKSRLTANGRELMQMWGIAV